MCTGKEDDRTEWDGGIGEAERGISWDDID
jgi:hypothetical protein